MNPLMMTISVVLFVLDTMSKMPHLSPQCTIRVTCIGLNILLHVTVRSMCWLCINVFFLITENTICFGGWGVRRVNHDVLNYGLWAHGHYVELWHPFQLISEQDCKPGHPCKLYFISQNFIVMKWIPRRLMHPGQSPTGKLNCKYQMYKNSSTNKTSHLSCQ